MKYTAQDETQAANITLGEAKCCICHKGRSPSAIFVTKGKAQCYICHKTLIKSCIFSYKQSDSVDQGSTTTLVFYNYSITVL